MNKTITREQIKARMDDRQPLKIIEALPRRYFDAEHLPGALNIPHDEILDKAPQMLPDKDELIVVYCASTECQNSRIATRTLQQMGYTNAVEYVEGKKDWMDAGLPVQSSGR